MGRRVRVWYGNVLGFSILKVSALRKAPLEVTL
jgi:hypothetical protein